MNKLMLITIATTVFTTHFGNAASCATDKSAATAALFKAIEVKDIIALKTAIDEGASVHEAKAYNPEQTPLTNASRALWPDGVHALITAGADVNEVSHHFTPLKYVVFCITCESFVDAKQLVDAETIMALLLQSGAEIDAGSPFHGPKPLLETLEHLSKELRHEKTRERYKTAHGLLTKVINSPENQCSDVE